MVEVNLAQLLVNSILSGSVYALLAVGLVLVYRILKFANFAHAEFITFGAYMAHFVNVALGGSIFIAAAFAFVSTGLLAVVCDLLFFKPLRSRKATAIPMMIVSIGLGLVIRHVLQEIWGPGVNYYALGTAARYNFLAATLTEVNLAIICSALGLVIVLHILLTQTNLGKAMRAVSDNSTLASIRGIDTGKIVLFVWFAGAGVAGFAGVLWGANTRLIPLMGWELLLPTFAVVVLGGLGSFYGVIVAAYLMGLVENVGVFAFIELSIPTTYRPAIAFATLIIVLLIRPEGLFGLRTTRGG